MSEETKAQAADVDAMFRSPALSSERRAVRQREEALDEALKALKANDRNPLCYIAAARALKRLSRLQEALEILRTGLSRCAPSAPLYEYYIERLEKCNRTEDAIAVAHQAKALFPDDWVFPLREALLLPVFYESRQQIDSYRRRFAENLNRIVGGLPLETAEQRHRALSAISRSSNKYLPYQGYNDRDLQTAYGTWVERVMTANYPKFAQPDPVPHLRGKVRIGFLTAFSNRFSEFSAGKLFGAWIREMDRGKFEVFAYHADNLADREAETVPRWGVPFHQLAGDFGEMARIVRNDRLHALIYLDFGIHPRMAQLAALRLAPIQCVAWDTPLTTGLPAMDYFLSSELMEPPDVSGHYSEELVRLSGVGVSFTKPVVPSLLLLRTRKDFGLRDDSVVYLCCQSIFKYSPEQDELVARIAKRVPNSQFVFLVTNEIVGNDLRRRMERVFESAGLRAQERCLWLPEMDVLTYWNLLRLGDVSLDTLGWSGGVSTFEAIACGLPIVTLPGEMMRSRHTSAILTQLGVTETIACDPAEYVEIAIRLGTDREWRQGIIDQIVDGFLNLYSDSRSIGTLEVFLSRTVRDRLRSRCLTERVRCNDGLDS